MRKHSMSRACPWGSLRQYTVPIYTSVMTPMNFGDVPRTVDPHKYTASRPLSNLPYFRTPENWRIPLIPLARSSACNLAHHPKKNRVRSKASRLMTLLSCAELGRYHGDHSCGYCGGHNARSFGFVTQGMRVGTYETLINRGWRRYGTPFITC